MDHKFFIPNIAQEISDEMFKIACQSTTLTVDFFFHPIRSRFYLFVKLDTFEGPLVIDGFGLTYFLGYQATERERLTSKVTSPNLRMEALEAAQELCEKLSQVTWTLEEMSRIFRRLGGSAQVY